MDPTHAGEGVLVNKNSALGNAQDKYVLKWLIDRELEALEEGYEVPHLIKNLVLMHVLLNSVFPAELFVLDKGNYHVVSSHHDHSLLNFFFFFYFTSALKTIDSPTTTAK